MRGAVGRRATRPLENARLHLEREHRRLAPGVMRIKPRQAIRLEALFPLMNGSEQSTSAAISRRVRLTLNNRSIRATRASWARPARLRERFVNSARSGAVSFKGCVRMLNI